MSTENTEGRQYDFDGTDPTVAIVQTLADVTGEEPTEVESLFDHVDPDALNTLLLSSNGSGHVTTVSFTVTDRRVNVGSDGFVVVTESD